MGSSRARTVVVVVPDGAHLLDVAGPAQVFASARDLGAPYEVVFVGDVHDPVTHQGLPVSVSTRWPDLTGDDLVLVAGWSTEEPQVPLSEDLLRRVREHHEAGGRVASICAGALALAAAGLLSGRRATTHHALVDRLERCRDVTVVRDVLYVCEDRLHTSAGISSGIDLALHLVSEDHGNAVAARVARSLVVPAWRPGGAPQASVLLRHRDHMSDLVHRAQDVLDTEVPPPPLAALAAALGASPRTLTRRFVEATGLTPHAYSAAVRRERAGALMAMGWTREAAAREVGYADARSLRPR